MGLMKRTTVLVWALVVLVCIVSSNAIATPDLNAPYWRGEEGTSFQLWNFSDNSNPDDSDAATDANPYDMSTAAMIHNKPFTPWIPADHGHQGIWYIDQGDWLVLYIPDSQDPNPTRLLYLQMIFYTAADDTGQNIAIGPVTADVQVITEEYLPGDEYYMYGAYQIVLQADSPLLELRIVPQAGTIYIDSIAVDVIPEPITMGLFGLGSMIIFARRKHYSFAPPNHRCDNQR